MPTTTLPVPKNSNELAEMLADPTRSAQILETKDTLAEFIGNYAKALQGDGTDLQRQISDETQRQLVAWMREHEAEVGLQAKRLNLDPQHRPAAAHFGHRQATAHNPKAAGASLDATFGHDPIDYISTIWHLNAKADAGKLATLRNAASSVSGADGGVLVPEVLRSQILSTSLEMSVVRPRATVVPMDSARVPFPMIDSTSNASSVFGGMIAYWGEESVALTDASPKFGRIVLDTKKLTGLSVVPNELLQDSIVSFMALLQTLWPQAVAFYEDRGFMGGTGTGEPLGFIGAGNPASIAITKEVGQAAATIVLENILNQYSRMLPASLNSAIWVVTPAAIRELYTMAISVGTGGAPVMLVNAAGPGPATMLGRPIVISEKASLLGTRGDVVFVDLSYYLIGDRQIMTADSSTDYRFGSDQTTFRIIQRVDGRPWLKNAITPANGGPTMSPFVEIENR